MTCNNCGSDKPLAPEFFHRHKNSRTGYSLICKVCIANDAKIYRAENAEKIRTKKKAAAQTPHGKAMKKANSARWRARHPTYMSNYHLEHREEILPKKRVYRLEHAEEENARSLKWAHEHPAERKAITDRYYANHPEECNTRALAWQAAHPAAFLAIARNHAHKRRALQAGSEINDFTNADFEALCIAFDYCCAYCGEKLPLTPDHFIPLTKGGTHTKSNIVPSCLACNRRKNDRLSTSPMPIPGDAPAWPTFEKHNYRRSKKQLS